METRPTASARAELNVTPMIDILLVLIIAFMLAVTARKDIRVQLPVDAPRGGSAADITLSVGAGPRYALNRQPVGAGELEARLRAVYASRPTKVLFVDGAPDATYQDVVRAMDVARGAGVTVLAATPRQPSPR